MIARKTFLLLALICALACFGVTAVAQSSGTFIASATNVIFAAGGNADPADFQQGGSNIATYPTDIPLPVGAASVTFSDVHGLVDCCGRNSSQLNGPDGKTNGPTNLTSVNSISGTKDTRVSMFLVGVFVDGTPSGPAPPTLTFDNGTFLIASPLLDQVFYVGDGHQGFKHPSGATQTFIVPAGATDLYLGFADGSGFSGYPGYYGDNYGSVSGNYQINMGE